ncbi:glutamate receptor ionotropic, delta-2-like [Palaemon carinicauda]|uniref:glutamate receptor ionotropic, delta-2-like n=1 Tax=Palaemon carinicauda TaxID=392227 RepID=UPI0035B61680
MANVQLKLCTGFFILSIILCLELKGGNDPTELENANDISRAIPAFDPRNPSHTKEEESEQTNSEPSRHMESESRKKSKISDELPQRGGQRVKKSTNDFLYERLLERKWKTRDATMLKSGRREETEANEEFENLGLKSSQEVSNDSIQFPDSERLLKTEDIEFQALSSLQMNKSLLCTASSGLDSNMVQVVTDVIRTITVTHLHLVFQSETSDCLLRRLWQQDIAMEVMSASQWWSRVSRLTYRSYSQHVLVGSVDWIAAVMNKVKLFYDNSSINALHTKWIWVVFDSLSQNSTLVTGPPPSASTATILATVSESLREGLRGVLIFRERTANSDHLSEKSQLFQDNSHIKVAAVEASGNGSWNLTVAGVWRFGILQKFNGFWPEPSFNFNNRTLRISCINKPMVFEYQKGLGLEAATGYLSDVMRIAQIRLNFSEVLLPTVGFGTPEPNGSWNGMVGVLQRKEADMSPLDFSPSYDRAQVVEFSIPVSEDILIIVSKAPSVVIKPFLILQIFSPFAWASIVGGAFFIEIAVEFMLRVESSFAPSQKERSTITHTLGNILKAFVGQTCEPSPTGNGARIAATSGLIVALIFGSLYKGFITAFLAIPFRSTPINSAEDLMASKTRPALRERTQFVETLVLAEYGILHPVRDRVGLFSESHISSREFFEKVADGTYGLADSYSSAIGRAKQFEKRGERCRFYKGKIPLRTDMDVFAFSQNSPFLHPFDDTIKWLRFFGIIDYFRNKYYALPCKAEVSSNDPQPMTLNQMQGSLYVLGIGLALGTAAFVFESLWPKVMMPGFSSSI